MSNRKYYAGIDYFRLAAVLFVVANHTSPLAAISTMGDFILTRVVARIAVPFFFMTSGFFTISRYDYHAERLGNFVKKTLAIYMMATLLYVPVNIYNGYFGMDNLLPNMIKDLVSDGTFYHLWYLPASVGGAGIAWYLIRKLDFRGALAVTSGLYLMGLFGDSYYGMVRRVPCLDGFYELLFQVSDYTRNGIFYAPVFFVLGGWIAERGLGLSSGKSIRGFCTSFLLMLAEALSLHRLGLQRHDSMYVLLLPCMYFLFHAILHMQGRRVIGLKEISLLVYIFHPMMIILIRLLAKLLHLQELLVENRMAHYFAVCLASMVFGIAAAVLWRKYRPEKTKHAAGTDRTYIEINLQNLEHNVGVLQDVMPPGCRLMAVVKAGAYGHGDFEISTCLDRIGVRAFAVATIDEGIRLRSYGVRGEILILGYTDPGRARELKKYKLIQTLIDLPYAEALNREGIPVECHIKIDTGMHRLGLPGDDPAKVEKIFGMKYLKVSGIYTHLGCADSLLPDDIAFTGGQMDQFYHLIDYLKDRGIKIPGLHVQSSYGLWNYPELDCDYVRAGIALYGVFSTPDSSTRQTLDLRPVLALKTRVALIRQIRKGDSVGYGRSFIADRDSLIAILPVGYADGIPRNLSERRGRVSIRGQYAPIAGRICMDQLAVDVTDIEHVSIGDVVTLISTDKTSELSAPAVADCAGTISNELLCRLGARLPVVVKQEGSTE